MSRPSLENFLLKTGVLSKNTLKEIKKVCDNDDDYRRHLAFTLYDVVSPKDRKALRLQIGLYYLAAKAK